MDYMAVIRRYQYQLAPHSVPQLAASADNPQHDLSACAVTEDVGSSLSVHKLSRNIFVHKSISEAIYQ